MAKYVVSVVVRSHEFRRLPLLRRALFSLSVQRSVDIQVILMTQRFSAEQQRQTREVAASVLSRHAGLSFLLNNIDCNPGEDLRGQMLNFGLGLADGRFLHILDDDDLMYHYAFELLASDCREFSAAVAFGRCVRVEGSYQGGFFYATRKTNPYRGSSIIELICDNFAPIHSYIFDRSKISKSELFFDENPPYLEDYRLLLRLLSKHPFCFNSMERDICEYWFYSNRSNTTSMRRDRYSTVAQGWREAFRQTQELKAKLMIELPLIDLEAWCRTQLATLSLRNPNGALYSDLNEVGVDVLLSAGDALRLVRLRRSSDSSDNGQNEESPEEQIAGAGPP